MGNKFCLTKYLIKKKDIVIYNFRSNRHRTQSRTQYFLLFSSNLNQPEVVQKMRTKADLLTGLFNWKIIIIFLPAQTVHFRADKKNTIFHTFRRYDAIYQFSTFDLHEPCANYVSGRVEKNAMVYFQHVAH